MRKIGFFGMTTTSRGERGTVTRRIATAMTVLTLMIGSPLEAGDVYWDNPMGGIFQFDENWQGGMAPGTNDRAFFSLDQTYTVDFVSNAATDWLLISDGVVTFDLGGFEYSVLCPASTPFDVTNATLFLTDGTLNASGSRGSIAIGTGTTGSVIVDDGVLNVAWFYVGENGEGSLTIQDGGNVTNESCSIGSSTEGTGTASLSGDTSSWTVSNWMTIAERGEGTLGLQDGASLTTANVTIGHHDGGIGEMTISGSETTCTSNDFVIVGGSGQGTLAVENGGTLTNVWSTIGDGSSGDGSVTVSGAESTWTQTGDCRIGNWGEGALTISGGGRVASQDSHIGLDPRGGGRVSIAGPDSTWEINNHLSVGLRAGGALTVENAGTVTCNWARIGNEAGSNGTVDITGLGSSWGLSGSLEVGESGVGDFSVADGGSVMNTWSDIGSETGSEGSVTLSGAASVWNMSEHLVVGARGRGSLLIENGAEVSCTWSRIADCGDSLGDVRVENGGTWTSNGELDLGNGTGCFLGFAGWAVDTLYDLSLEPALRAVPHDAASMSVSWSAGGEGWEGADNESWAIENLRVYVHDEPEGEAMLVYSNGFDGDESFGVGVTGSMSGAGIIEDSQGCAGYGHPGNEIAGSFWRNDTVPPEATTLSLDGLPSHAYVSVEFILAALDSWDGNGDPSDYQPDTFSIAIDGLNLFEETLSQYGPSDQTYSPAPGALIDTCTNTGHLAIASGGTASCTDAVLGSGWRGVGEVTVSGTGSQWDVTRYLIVGREGGGSLVIDDGGEVITDQCFLAWMAPSSLTVRNGSRLTASSIEIQPDGSLVGNATIRGNVYNCGRVAPEAYTDPLTIEGDYYPESAWSPSPPPGTVAIEIGGAAEDASGKLAITGTAMLAGTLEVSFANGFDPQPGDSFEILAAESIVGRFDWVTGWSLGGGRIAHAVYSETGVSLQVGDVAGLTIHPSSVEVFEGFTRGLMARANLGLGGEADVSSLATWSSDAPAVVSVADGGEIRGMSVGSTTIRAGFLGFEASASVSVIPLPPGPLATERVSLSTTGEQGELMSGGPLGISADTGRFVAFYSDASNLVTGDTNGTQDVFVRDTETGVTIRVSVDSAGVEGDGVSYTPVLSGDGRFVAFCSYATNLAPNDTNGVADIFVRDRDADDNGVFDEAEGVGTVRISVDSAGAEGDAASYRPSVSADGRFVSFYSGATNLVSDDTNGVTDGFVHDRDADGNGIFDEPGGIRTVRVTVDSAGVEGDRTSSVPFLSADGRFTTFFSYATNLVPGDTNGVADAFVHDRDADGNGVFDEPGGIETTRVSVSTSGEQANGSSQTGGISADGRWVVISSNASNLAQTDTNPANDVFVHDRLTGETRCVSVSSAGEQGEGDVGSLCISADGRFVGYRSAADGLVPDDHNGTSDVFRHDLLTGQTVRMSVSFFGGDDAGLSGWTSLTSDGRIMAFQSEAENLVPFDTNGVMDVFVRRDDAGDLDCDGDIDMDDLAVFVETILDPDVDALVLSACPWDKADMNGDAVLNGSDIQLFADALLGPDD